MNPCCNAARAAALVEGIETAARRVERVRDVDPELGDNPETAQLLSAVLTTVAEHIRSAAPSGDLVVVSRPKLHRLACLVRGGDFENDLQWLAATQLLDEILEAVPRPPVVEVPR